MSKDQVVWLDAQKDFAAQWGLKNQWCYGFEDTRAVMKGNTDRMKLTTKERPADFLVVDNGRTFFAEVKSSQDKVSFNLNNVEVGQWKAAIRSTAAGGDYLFFVRSEELGKWYMVPAFVFIDQRQTKKSIKWTELEPYFWKLKHELITS